MHTLVGYATLLGRSHKFKDTWRQCCEHWENVVGADDVRPFFVIADLVGEQIVEAERPFIPATPYPIPVATNAKGRGKIILRVDANCSALLLGIAQQLDKCEVRFV